MFKIPFKYNVYISWAIYPDLRIGKSKSSLLSLQNAFIIGRISLTLEQKSTKSKTNACLKIITGYNFLY
jgi:hypothetical protein